MAGVLSDVVLLLEQVNTSPRAWNIAIDQMSAFVCLHLLVKTISGSLLSAGRVSSTPSLSYLQATLHSKPIMESSGALVPSPFCNVPSGSRSLNS